MANKYTDAILTVQELSITKLEIAIELIDFENSPPSKFLKEYFMESPVAACGYREQLANFYCLLASLSNKEMEEFISLYK